MTPEPELPEDEALIMAARCPIIRAAYESGNPKVIRRMENAHPPSRCRYVKEAKTENELPNEKKTGAKAK